MIITIWARTAARSLPRLKTAQRWFDRGLLWGYGYNHDESVSCYRRAVAADPDCAMAYWGIAYSSGCNYNKPWDDFDPEELSEALATAYDATEQALQRPGRTVPC